MNIKFIDNLEEEINIGVSSLVNKTDLEKTDKIKVTVLLERQSEDEFKKELSNFEWIK